MISIVCRFHRGRIVALASDGRPLPAGLARHVDRCPSCRASAQAAVELAQSLRDSLSDLDPLPADLLHRVSAAALACAPSSTPRHCVVGRPVEQPGALGPRRSSPPRSGGALVRRRVPRVYWGGALAAAAAAVIAIVLILSGGKPTDQPPAPRVRGPVAAPALAALSETIAPAPLLDRSLEFAQSRASDELQVQARALANEAEATGRRLVACLPVDLGARTASTAGTARTTKTTKTPKSFEP